MFVDVNTLRALIVNVPVTDIVDDSNWRTISETIRCVFICQNEEEKVLLNEVVHSQSQYIQSSIGMFGTVQTVHNAVRMLGVNLCEVAFVTTKVFEIQATLSERFGTILLNSNDFDFDTIGGYMPDFHIPDSRELVGIIEGEDKGYYAEVRSTQVGRGQRWLSDGGYVHATSLTYDNQEIPILTGGRYYGQKHVTRASHQLSHRITNSKNRPNQDGIFSAIFSGITSLVHDNVAPVNGITRVPPRPSSDRDRLAPIVANVCNQLGITDNSGSLVCTEDYPKQKGLSRDERLENIRGKFRATSDVNGKHIVLIDDVLTTGATALECATKLLGAGATQVTVVVLAINQFPVAAVQQPTLQCPECSSDLVFRFNRENSPFFGCTRYPECRGVMGYMDGWRTINSSHELHEEDNEEFTF